MAAPTTEAAGLADVMAPAPAPQAWAAAADGWDQHRDMLSAWLAEATAAMLDAAALGPCATVLNAAAGRGCRCGPQTLDIARRVQPGGQVLATDVSARNLALAAHKLQRAGHGQVMTGSAPLARVGSLRVLRFAVSLLL